MAENRHRYGPVVGGANPALAGPALPAPIAAVQTLPSQVPLIPIPFRGPIRRLAGILLIAGLIFPDALGSHPDLAGILCGAVFRLSPYRAFPVPF